MYRGIKPMEETLITLQCDIIHKGKFAVWMHLDNSRSFILHDNKSEREAIRIYEDIVRGFKRT